MTSNRAVPFSHSFQSHMIHDRRRESHCIATVDTRITSFRTCGQELMEAFDVPHLLANHCSSVACWEKWRMPPQQLRESQQRPRWWWVKGFSGSTIHPMPAQPTKSVATQIWWTCTNRRASDTNCKTTHLT